MNELDRNKEIKLEIQKTLSLSIINYQLFIINYEERLETELINSQLSIIRW